MPTDPRLESALALAARIGRLRAADGWSVEKVETGPSVTDEGEDVGFVLVVYLRHEEEEAEEIGFRERKS